MSGLLGGTFFLRDLLRVSISHGWGASLQMHCDRQGDVDETATYTVICAAQAARLAIAARYCAISDAFDLPAMTWSIWSIGVGPKVVGPSTDRHRKLPKGQLS